MKNITGEGVRDSLQSFTRGQVLTPTDPDNKQDCQHTTHQTVTTCCFQHTWQMDVCCIRSLLTYLLFSVNDYNIHTRNCLSCGGPCKCHSQQTHMRQEGSLVQHDLASVGWTSESDPGQLTFDIFKHNTTLEKSFLVIVITIMLKAWLHQNSFAKNIWPLP